MRVLPLAPGDVPARAGAIPWARWGVHVSEPGHAWLDGDTGALAVHRHRRAYGTSLAVVGEPSAALELAAAVAPGLDVTSVTLPRAATVPPGPLVGPRPKGVAWDWMWTSSAPAAQRGEERVRELDASCPRVRAELAAFLAANSPLHSAEPDDHHARRWLGIRGGDGELLACVALYEAVPGVDLMASVAVAAGARGQGLGVAITAAATRRSLLERPPVATVDLYADNPAAHALYRRLGYRLDQEFASYELGGA